MSMNFQITSTWLDHSTKFYQLFKIELLAPNRSPTPNVGVTVGHYGAHKALPSNGDRRPIVSGQTIVYSLPDTFRVKLDEKIRKGYRASGGSPVESFSEAELRQWLRQNLPTERRNEVLEAFGLSLDPSAQPIDPSDEPTPAPETISRAPEETPEGWGDW